MDVNAILAASRQDFMQLGLNEKGHILCLKSFAMKHNSKGNSDKREELVEAIKKTSVERTKKVNHIKTIQLGWKHSNGSMFYQVRKQSGGGVRELPLDMSTKLVKVKEEALKLFFPKGNSIKFGSLKNIDSEIGDFSGESIVDLSQSIDSYIKSTKLVGKPRLYLLTTKRNELKMLYNIPSFSSSDDDDFERALPSKPCYYFS